MGRWERELKKEEKVRVHNYGLVLPLDFDLEVDLLGAMSGNDKLG